MPTVAMTGNTAWADVVAQRIAKSYRAAVHTAQQGYVARLADEETALILVDGDQPGWTFWVTTPKVNAATRRIPVVLVSSDAATREQGILVGADFALSPADLLEQLDDLLDDVARVVDPEQAAAMTRQCAEPLPPEARDAIEKFNRGDYYQQHDLFEALWMQETGPVRDLYRAILQVGIAYYQITRGNQRGALKMLLRSIQWLALLPDACQGVDIDVLKRDAAAVRAELERLGPDRLSDFDLALLKPVKYEEKA